MKKPILDAFGKELNIGDSVLVVSAFDPRRLLKRKVVRFIKRNIKLNDSYVYTRNQISKDYSEPEVITKGLTLSEWKLLCEIQQKYALAVMDEAGNTARRPKKLINDVNKLLAELGNTFPR